MPEIVKKIPKVIVFSLDNSIESDLKNKLQAYGAERMVVITKDKVRTALNDNPISRNTLVIHGFDLNFISLIEKMFNVL